MLVAVATFSNCSHAEDDAQAIVRDRLAASVLAQLQSAADASSVLILDTTVNGQPGGSTFVYRDATGLAVEETALKRWRIEFPVGAAREVDGRRYIPLTTLPGTIATIDERTQRLALTMPAPLFRPSDVVVAQVPGIHLVPPPWAAFANYELFGYSAPGSTYGSALFEAGVSGPYGSGVGSFITNSAQLGGAPADRTVLLDANWRYDDPANLRTLQFGTVISPAGAWGQSLRFAGVQYGTNFELQPNLITYPLQGFNGSAVVPSTVDILVNGSRVATQQVQPGPFTINNVPLVTGSGNVQLVVRDAFGQQQVMTLPFYASRQLLKPGLDDFSINFGSERLDYGSRSFKYGSAFGSAYWRRGINESVTVEVDAAGDNYARVAGGAIDFLPWDYGVFTLGGASSAGDAGNGYLGLFGYQYQGSRLNLSFRSLWASPAFRLPGDNPASDTFAPPLQRSILGSVGLNLGTMGTIGTTWIDQQFRGQPSNRTGIVSYTANLAPRTFLTLSASRSLGDAGQTTLFASITYMLDDRTSASASVTANDGGNRSQTFGGLSVQRSIPVGEGWGYDVAAYTDQQYRAGATYAGRYGRYSVEVAGANGDTGVRGSIAGGIGTLDGVVFASRPIVDSFGIVRVGGVPDVPVFQNGNFAGRTDRDGVMVLTELFPYLDNRIRIDDRNVPIDVTMTASEQLAAPYYRSGVIFDFGSRKRQNAVLLVRLPDGKPLPPGSEVRRRGTDTTYPVGFNGEVFVDDLLLGSVFLAEWPRGRCEFAVDAASPLREALPRLGPFICGGGGQ